MVKLTDFKVFVANEEHNSYSKDISLMIANAAIMDTAGIAIRTPEYIEDKIKAGKAIIALINDMVAGFCYIEEWSHQKFIANSGLIIRNEFRKCGLATKIKMKAFQLSRDQYPKSKLFGLTTNPAVMKINSKLGYKPVIYSDLTTDSEFWKGCRTCYNNEILIMRNYLQCLCTAMLFDPVELNIKDDHGICPEVFEVVNEKIF